MNSIAALYRFLDSEYTPQCFAKLAGVFIDESQHMPRFGEIQGGQILEKVTGMRLLLTGFLMLGIAAYLDTIRGPLMTFLQEQLGLSHGQGSRFFVAGSVASISMTLALNRLFVWQGERRVGVGALLLGLMAALLGVVVRDYGTVLLLGAGLGAAAAALGTTSNVFVIRGSRPEALSRNLCGLHAMYGAGSAVAPLLLSNVLEWGLHWSWALIGLPAVIGGIGLLMLPTHIPDEVADEQGPGRALGGMEVLILVTIAAYVCGEVLCSLWMTSYLTAATDLDSAAAAPVLSGFFGAMFTVRLLAFGGLKADWEIPILLGSLVVGLLGQVLGLLGWVWGLSMAGGMGLFFPVFFARVSRLFPQRWRTLAVWMFAATQIGLVIMNVVMGHMADIWSIVTAYWLPPAALLLCTLCTVAYLVMERSLRTADQCACVSDDAPSSSDSSSM